MIAFRSAIVKFDGRAGMIGEHFNDRICIVFDCIESKAQIYILFKPALVFMDYIFYDPTTLYIRMNIRTSITAIVSSFDFALRISLNM